MDTPERYTIMVVDDNRHLLVVLDDYLTFQGYDVVTATSAEDALRKLKRVTPSLIVLDISMPGMGGMGFLKRISAGGGKLKYPVLVLTARTTMEDFFENLDVEGFLPKPCSETELARWIREILGRRDAEMRAKSRRGRKVLVVENDPPALGEIQRVFHAAGFSVEAADNAHDVLGTATTDRPDAILIKEALPKMSGTLISSLLGAMPNTRTIPVILYDEKKKSDVDFETPQGVARVLHTADPDSLLRAVEEVLGLV